MLRPVERLERQMVLQKAEVTAPPGHAIRRGFSFVSRHPVQRGGAGHGKPLIAAVAFLYRNITITQQPCAISVRFGEAGRFHVSQPSLECVWGH